MQLSGWRVLLYWRLLLRSFDTMSRHALVGIRTRLPGGFPAAVLFSAGTAVIDIISFSFISVAVFISVVMFVFVFVFVFATSPSLRVPVSAHHPRAAIVVSGPRLVTPTATAARVVLRTRFSYRPRPVENTAHFTFLAVEVFVVHCLGGPLDMSWSLSLAGSAGAGAGTGFGWGV